MKNFFIIISIVCIFFASANSILAQNTGGNNPCTSTSATCLANPLSVSSPQALIGKVINAVLGVVGSLALLMFVYGGLIWMTSSGNPEKIKQGRGIIVWAAIGLAIIFSSYALTRILILNLK